VERKRGFGNDILYILKKEKKEEWKNPRIVVGKKEKENWKRKSDWSKKVKKVMVRVKRIWVFGRRRESMIRERVFGI